MGNELRDYLRQQEFGYWVFVDPNPVISCSGVFYTEYKLTRDEAFAMFSATPAGVCNTIGQARKLASFLDKQV